MKKLILIFITCAINYISASGQIMNDGRLMFGYTEVFGYTESQLVDEIPFVDLKKDTLKDGRKIMTYEDKYGTWIYRFDRNGIIDVIREITYPDKINVEIERLNKNSIIISETEWREYVNGNIIFIHLTLSGKNYCIDYTAKPM